MSRTRYKRVGVGQWKWAGEHINVKGGRVSLIALRRTCWTVKSLGRRVLMLSDNLASIGAFGKGRGVGGLAPLCKRAAAYRLGGEIQWRLRYIETGRNPADADSRLRPGQLIPAEVRTACDASASAPAGQFCIRPPPGLERPPARLALASVGSEQLHGSTVVGPCSRGSRPRASAEMHAARSITLDMATHTSSSSTSKVPISTPHITQHIESIHRGYCLELFAGCARLAEAGAAHGLHFLIHFELSRSNVFDLSRKTTQDIILDMARLGKFVCVHLGTSCTVLSRARHNITNFKRARARERLGVEFALFSATLCHVLSRRGCHWSIENPAGSRPWDFEPMMRLRGLPNVRAVTWDMCFYKTHYKKRIALLANLSCLEKLAGDCTRDRDHQHTVLQGTERVRTVDGEYKWQNRTMAAGAYPVPLCARWASLLKGALGPQACSDRGDRSLGFEAKRLFCSALRRAMPRRPRAVIRATATMDDEPSSVERNDTECAAADSYLKSQPLIQFGQDSRPHPWRPHGHRPGESERPLRRSRKRKATSLNPAPGVKIDKGIFLITSTVQAPTLARYGAAVAEFEKFAHSEHLSLARKRVDRSMTICFVALFGDGFSAIEGRSVFYGYRLVRPRTTGRSVLPLARASLKGWQRRVLGRMWLLVTEDVALQIGCDLILHRHPDAAFVMALRLDAYLRPSGVVKLRMAQLLPPAPDAGKQFAGSWGVVIAPQEFEETAKTGQTDDSMLIADKAYAWLNAALALVYQKGAPDTQPVFPRLSLPRYERLVAESARRLGLDQSQVCPHVVRHSGASNDRFLGRRTFLEIQKRGRRTNPESVARYAREAMLFQVLKKLAPGQQAAAKTAASNFCSALLTALRPQTWTTST